MKLRTILAGTAVAALSLVAAPQPGGSAFIAPAEAAVNINIGIFYDRLGQYGDWVNYENEYVFIPGRVDAGWRPYTEGHWVYTRHYGWTWVSDEPFGWATYHYGRWGYSDEIGWYWVPGRKWAPAWVSWRRSNNYVVWAPLPPARHGGGLDVSIDINVGDIPDYYWVAVPTRRFLAPDLQVVVVHDDREIRNVVRQTEYVGTPRITNNIVVNNVIDVNVISRETGTKVEAVDVKTTNNPAEAKSTATQVTAFQGEIATDAQVKPKKLADVNQVRKVKRKKLGDEQNASPAPDATAPATGNTSTAPADNSTAGSTTPPASADAMSPADGKNRKKKIGSGNTAPADTTGQSAAPVTSEPPATQAQDAQPANKKKKKDASAPSTAEPPATAAQDQPMGKKKRRQQQQQNENASAPAGGEQPLNQAQGQTGKKKKKQQGGDEATGSTTMPSPQTGNGGGNAPDQNANVPADQKKKGKGKKDQACDPNDPSCAAQ